MRQLTRRLAAAAVVVWAIGAPAALAQDRLGALEAALAAAPGDLRAGDEYRRGVIEVDAYDRAIAFFEKLVAAHSDESNLHLNFGFAYVDKIPAAGSITQVILANNALNEFTRALELAPSWIGYYTRGNSYLFWPKIFGRTPLGITDLEEAVEIQRSGDTEPYHARAWVALGDGYWKMDDLARAREVWTDALSQFPGNTELKARVSAEGDALKALMDRVYDPAIRVDTSLRDLWSNR